MCGEEFDSFCCRFTTLSRVIEWLPYPEPCVSCQSPAAAGLGSPGDSRSHSGHVGNTRRRRLITCCRLWPSARRFWLGLHLGLHSPQKQVNFTNYATKLSQNYYTTGFRHFSGNEHPYSVIFKSIFHDKLLQNSGIWRGKRVHTRHARDLIKLGTTSIFCHFWYFVINFSKPKFP